MIIPSYLSFEKVNFLLIFQTKPWPCDKVDEAGQRRPDRTHYVRLSLEDGDLASDKLKSESITNQRNMLTDYIRNVPDLCGAEIIEFCDDGYSGKNFDRPGVKRLLEAAQNGGIQCVVVKDISRFGRDYITVGNYITRVFPFLNVRFIAINDHFDSIRQGDIDSLDTSFKTLICDMYSRDLSQKVRSAKKHLT